MAQSPQEKALHAKKSGKKMTEVKLGNFKDSHVGYRIEDHKGNTLKEHVGKGRFALKNK